jgi:hypothetical protein
MITRALLCLALLLSSTAAAAQATVTGSVVDGSGRGIRDVELRVVTLDGATVGTAITDHTGRFTVVVDAPGDSLAVTLDQPGFRAVRHRVRPGTPVRIRLRTVTPHDPSRPEGRPLRPPPPERDGSGGGTRPRPAGTGAL